MVVVREHAEACDQTEESRVECRSHADENAGQWTTASNELR